eukprot:scaffold72757_cov17-Tisochrysis_lutea.AAC.1
MAKRSRMRGGEGADVWARLETPTKLGTPPSTASTPAAEKPPPPPPPPPALASHPLLLQPSMPTPHAAPLLPPFAPSNPCALQLCALQLLLLLWSPLPLLPPGDCKLRRLGPASRTGLGVREPRVRVVLGMGGTTVKGAGDGSGAPCTGEGLCGCVGCAWEGDWR